ncbi:hypothetical protein E1091_18055 [Micromonospora fluostatini]|uniref:Uncharacterized protein n=1 Tax=Micromonospora fluostatini TaxID=1629071 RepID=A0ABY2DFK7_9ACTN|nr:hypothetical protein E1091_18055 [Micromonospora fluostatini]
MKIDDRTEALVRTVLDAVVHRNPAGFEKSVSDLEGKVGLRAGIELAAAICAFVLFDVYEGLPSEEQIVDLAVDMERQEQWMAPDRGEIGSYVRALVHRQPLEGALTEEGVVVIPWLVAANLLTTASQPEQGEWWFNYLDKVEAAIEAAG